MIVQCRQKGVLVNMNMTVSVNKESGVPYLQYGTDRQKAKAAKFAKADNKELTNLANNINIRKHRDSKFNRNIARTVAAVPVIAGAAAAIATKGKVSTKALAAAKSTLLVGGGMALIGGVVNLNNKIAAKNEKVANAEKKHPLLTLAGLTALATGVVTKANSYVKVLSPKAGEKLTKLAKKVKLDKFAEKMDKAPEAVRTMASKVAEKVSLPQGVKENLSKISAKVKMPQFLKDGYSKIANAETTKTAMSAMGKAGKTMLKNPVTTTAAVVGALIIGNAAKRGVEVAQTKSKLKEAQLKTANNLINAYAAENDSLKTANMKAAEALEKGNAVVAEDAAKAEDAE